jgi:predicted PurR-regulated permease PerM
MLLAAGSMAFGADASMFAPPAAFLALHALEANFISPLVMGKRLRLSPVSVFLSVMVWGWIWGIAGALVAVPILLALRTVCKRSRRLRLLRVYLEGDASDAPSLRSLLRVKRRAPARRAEQPAAAE